MKKLTGLLIACVIVLASCNKPNFKVKLKNENDTISYLIGLSVAKNLKSNDMAKLNPEAVARAFSEVFAGDSIKFTDQEINMKLQMYFTNLQIKAGEKYLKEGQEFLEKNKKNPGVIVLPSGLQYQVIKEGTGPKPDSSSVVSVHYTGTLINGDTFESNIGREPATFPVTHVIKGWTDALLMMNVGSKWKLFIPTNLAYGENIRPGGKIKPNMALIFEIELLGIEPKAKEQPASQPEMQLKKR